MRTDMTITEEMKKNMFIEMLKTESEMERVGEESRWHRTFADYGDGIYKMFSILGIGEEYIEWSYNKTAKQKIEPFKGLVWVAVDEHGNEVE